MREAQKHIDAREFEEWLLYSQLEPWDETRADWRAGLVASTLVNCLRAPDTPTTPVDFLPQFAPETEPEIDEDAMIAQMQQQFEFLVQAAGGAVLDGEA